MVSKIKYICSVGLVFILIGTGFTPVKAETIGDISTRALDVQHVTNKVAYKTVTVGDVKVYVNIRYDYYRDLNGNKWIDEIKSVSSTIAPVNSSKYTVSGYEQRDWYEESNSTTTKGVVTGNSRYSLEPIGGGSILQKNIEFTVSFVPGD